MSGKTVGDPMEVYSRAKGFASTLAVLLLTVSAVALLVGLSGYVLALEPSEREASLKIVELALAFGAVSLSVLVPLRRYFIVDIVDALLVVSVFWLLAPLFSAALYSYTIGMPLLDALFESMSGFTGTGLTVVDRPEALPRVVLFWRALTQWIGELGVVVFSGVFLPFLHRTIRSVYAVERGARLAPTVISTTRRLFTIYVAYTILGALLFTLSGMEPLDSLMHSMTAIATGGMSSRSESLGYWFWTGRGFVAFSAVVVMVIGSLNFMDLYNLTLGRLREFARSVEVRGFAALLAVFLALLGVSAIATNSQQSFWTWSFHLVSGFTTTGFSLTPVREHPDAVKVVITLSMVVGGATFSTSGGIKIKRAAIMVRSVLWEMGRVLIPKPAVVVRRVGGEVIRDEELVAVLSYVSLYALTLVSVSVLLHLSLISSGLAGYSYVDSLFEAASALSCVGLSTGITSSATPAVAKALLMASMYLGRIEFLPLYVLVGEYYKRKVTL